MQGNKTVYINTVLLSIHLFLKADKQTLTEKKCQYAICMVPTEPAQRNRSFQVIMQAVA